MTNFRPPFSAEMTLVEAQNALRPMLDKGERCPCCTQFAKVYRRSLPSASGRVLIALLKAGADRDYIYIPPLLESLSGTATRGGYGTLSVHWGLIARKPGQRDDGSDRVGWWKLTPDGTAFARGWSTVPKYARLYNGRCLGTEGDPITIQDALGKKFNYDELMAGV